MDLEKLKSILANPEMLNLEVSIGTDNCGLPIADSCCDANRLRVLVLCTGNSCRSQMAEGLFRVLGSGKWESYSAGSKPSGYVHPLAIEAMKERDIDISSGVSKSVDEFSGQEFDLVVTVCDNANEACPFFLVYLPSCFAPL